MRSSAPISTDGARELPRPASVRANRVFTRAKAMPWLVFLFSPLMVSHDELPDLPIDSLVWAYQQ